MKKTFSLRENNYLYILILFFASIGHLLFSLRTNNFFSVDDFATLSFFKSHTVLQMVPEFLIHGDLFHFRRLVGFIAFGGLFRTFGANYMAYEISMFTIHTINILLIFLITFGLTKNRFAAFFVSLIFNKNYLFYYSNIHELLLGLFCFLTVYFFLERPKKFYLSVTAFIFALFTKETAATLPVFLLALSFVNKKLNKKKIVYLFLMSGMMGLYYLYFFVKEKVNIPNFSYTSSLSPFDVWNGIVFFLGYPVILFTIVWPMATKKYKYLPIFLASLAALIPASTLVNRRELYYLYMPFGYLMIYLGLILPKFNLKSLFLYVLVFIVFGGRSIFPKVAWHVFTNWQKNSMEEVIVRVESGLPENSGTAEVDIGDINLERDARLMLQSGTTDLFVKKSYGSIYNFKYLEGEGRIVISKK